jgi:hypothetical protein
MFWLCSVRLILLICWTNWPSIVSDNPTAIVTPYSGPDPGYILAESDGGLSNRLRVLAAYMYIAEAQHQGFFYIYHHDHSFYHQNILMDYHLYRWLTHIIFFLSTNYNNYRMRISLENFCTLTPFLYTTFYPPPPTYSTVFVI